MATQAHSDWKLRISNFLFHNQDKIRTTLLVICAVAILPLAMGMRKAIENSSMGWFLTCTAIALILVTSLIISFTYQIER